MNLLVKSNQRLHNLVLILKSNASYGNNNKQMQEDILQKAKQFNQQHLVQHYKSITDEKLKNHFLEQLKAIDFQQTDQLYKDVYLHHKNNPATEKKVEFEPLKHAITRCQIEKQEKEFDDIGFKSISMGQVGVCIMSGGQGTRLGFDHPKGMFNIQLQSNYTLFEYFARRLLRLMEITKKKHPESKFTQTNMIKWYIMTSDMNHQQIVNFFKEHKYFNYDPESIYFFPQGGIPAVDYNGKIMIQSEGNLSLAPGGNGAMYVEMKNKGALNHMKKHGVKYLYIAPVDNVLLKLADPTCVGYMIKNGFEIVSMYVKKAYPEEKLGVHVLSNGKVNICEYSEMPKQLTEQRDAKGELTYCHGGRATMIIAVDFVEKITTSPQLVSKINKKYHLAEKKIKFYDPATKTSHKPEQNNGVKFQLFYFDVFEECEKFGLFETLRQDEFAPVKNATGVDSPQSARKLLRDLHAKWLKKAGVETQGEGYVQIDPRLCYNGECLQELIKEKCHGKVKLPASIC